MRTMRWGWSSLVALVMLGTGLVNAADKPAGAKVDVKVVKLDPLKDLIRQQKGKVVVVDFWADT